MTWTITDDVGAFLGAAAGFLHARAAENTLLLTVADIVRQAGPAAFGAPEPVYGWWRGADGAVAGAFLQTPPRPMLLSTAPPAALTSLADALAGAGHRLPGVSADPETADAFAAAWQERTGAAATPGARMRLYRLVDLRDPHPMPDGYARPAGDADLDLLTSWWQAFHRHIGEVAHRPRDAVADKVRRAELTVWEAAGRPVAMATRTQPVAGMVRILAVYTPPELRRRGYAGAVTAAASRLARAAGADPVVLYTDLANPTSNALYQRLGYRPGQDRIVVSFGP